MWGSITWWFYLADLINVMYVNIKFFTYMSSVYSLLIFDKTPPDEAFVGETCWGKQQCSLNGKTQILSTVYDK